MQSYYDILRVPIDADLRRIRASYLVQIKNLHPDTGASPNPEHLRLVMEAYRVLSNPDLRDRYDRQLGLKTGKMARGVFKRTRALIQHWLTPSQKGEPSVGTTDAPPTETTTPPRPPRPRTPFSETLKQAKARGNAPFERGADGIIRRTEPADDLPLEGRTGHRPTLKRPATVTKPTPWKLWR